MRRAIAYLIRRTGLLLRMGQVGVLVAGHGLIIGIGAAVRKLRGTNAGTDGGGWVRMLNALGPSYIKIGQLLSTRKDLLPEAVCTQLSRLTDSPPPPRRRRAEQVIRRAYRDREWPFAEFDWTPVASGSIAVVHRAVTTDGRAVAVKVRRPGISRVMRRDFELTAALMKLLGALPPFRSMPVSVMFDQVGGAILHQLDFRAERESLVQLRSNLSTSPDIVIPAPLPEFCTDDVIVMDYIENLVRFEPGDLTAAARRHAARRVLSAIYEMLFIDGLVHCDLHPGNLYLYHDSKIAILDAGFVIELPESVRASFADFFINMTMGNGPMCAQIVFESAAQVALGFDFEQFSTELSELIAETTGMRSGDFSLARFAGRLFSLQRKHGLYPAPEFAFPLLSLLVLEGMVKSFDPDTDFQAEATPILRRRNMPRAAVS